MESSIEREKRELFSNLRREIRDERVLKAMEEVPREMFVPVESRHLSYRDAPLPIGEGQTISQPFIVALMLASLQLKGWERVMELGTGSGYQAAILARLVPNGHVLSVERIPKLAARAVELLSSLGYDSVEVRVAGSALGCRERAPFDAIIVSAASPKLPQALLDQMVVGGRMVIPIGTLHEQAVVNVLKTSEGPSLTMLGPCRFVPLVGTDAWPEEPEET